jgi:hypothetical protein
MFLVPLTVVDRDRLGVLPQAHQAKPEVSFAPALIEMQGDHLLAEDAKSGGRYDARV